MLTVDERARSMLIAQYGRGTMHPTTEMQIRKYNLSALPSDTAAALRALTTAINQLDEARAVALEERSAIVNMLIDEWNGLHGVTSDSGRKPDRADKETLIRMDEVWRIKQLIEEGKHRDAV